MKAACFAGVQQISTQNLTHPVLHSDLDAIVRVEMAGLCGSDLHPYFGREKGIATGTVMGHEFVGEVVEVGSQVSARQLGERVCAPFSTNCGNCQFCKTGLTSRCVNGELFGWRQNGVGLHGGQANFVRVPNADATLVPIPTGMNHETAILLGDNLSTGYFATDLTQITPEETFVVIGCGTVGLLAIQWAITLGCNQVVAVEPNHERRELAKQLGAITARDENSARLLIDEQTDGLGADGVMEFVGLPDAQKTAYNLIRPGGRMAVIGCHCTPNFAFSPSQAYDKNLTYRTGRCPARSYMSHLPQIVEDKKMDLSWCITHRFTIDQAEKAYRTFSTRAEGCIKAVFEF